jgi:hypothetical protein
MSKYVTDVHLTNSQTPRIYSGDNVVEAIEAAENHGYGSLVYKVVVRCIDDHYAPRDVTAFDRFGNVLEV